MKTCIIFTLLSLIGFTTQAQKYAKEITEEKSFDIPGKSVTVLIKNLYGDVTVKSTDGDEVIFKIKKYYRGYKQEQLNQALAEVQVGWVERNDSVVAYIKAPFICNKWNNCPQGRSWVREHEKYEFNFHFEVFVPTRANVTAETLTQGNIRISGVEGVVCAQNVEGHVSITDAVQVQKAFTVEGNIEVRYVDQPTINGQFNTVSGDVKLYCTESLSAQVFSKSMNGEFFTSYDYEPLTPRIERTSERSGEKAIFSIHSKTGIQIGGAEGPKLTMETLSGDMYLRSL